MPSALDIQPLLPGWDAISEGYMYLFPFSFTFICVAGGGVESKRTS